LLQSTDIAVGGETVIPIRSCAFLSENGSLVNSDGKQGTDQPSSLKPGSSTLGTELVSDTFFDS